MSKNISSFSELEFSKVPMPTVKQPSSNGDRLCYTCNKEDVCMYKRECIKAAEEITKISERTNVFINTDIKCEKWSSKVSDYKYIGVC